MYVDSLNKQVFHGIHSLFVMVCLPRRNKSFRRPVHTQNDSPEGTLDPLLISILAQSSDFKIMKMGITYKSFPTTPSADLKLAFEKDGRL